MIGYQIKLWRRYPVLVGGKPFQPVDGLACEIVSRECWDRLVGYARDLTDQYDLSSILIDCLDTGEEEVEGVAFQWVGDTDELRDGSFSLESWLREQDLSGS